VGDALDPRSELGIEVIDGAEASRREEGVAQVLDLPRATAQGLGAKW
jgi:hypothetical protein